MFDVFYLFTRCLEVKYVLKPVERSSCLIVQKAISSILNYQKLNLPVCNIFLRKSGFLFNGFCKNSSREIWIVLVNQNIQM